MPEEASQKQEVVARAVLRVLGKRIGVLAGAAFKAQLQHPDQLDVGNKAMLNRKLLALRGDHVLGGAEKGLGAHHALALLVAVPALLDLRPQERREKKRGRNLFARSNALVGTPQGEHEKLLALVLVENDIEHRQ